MMIWHAAYWELDITESDGCYWVLSLEWDDGDYHPSTDPWIDGNAETATIWDPVSDEELQLRMKR